MILLFLLLFLGGCASPPDPWKLDVLATGYPQYDSSRLSYHSPLSHLSLEFLHIGQETVAYLFLQQFKFAPISPNSSLTTVAFTIGDAVFQESLPLREGHMRLKLSAEITQQIINGLQEGKKIAIVYQARSNLTALGMASGIQEIISPDLFTRIFAKFLQGDEPLNFIRGPFE